MNMKQLFDDFSAHVDAMNDNDIAQSISDAIKHTANSYILDGIVETEVSYSKSSTQETVPINRTASGFMFCSSGMSVLDYSYEMSATGGNAA